MIETRIKETYQVIGEQEVAPMLEVNPAIHAVHEGEPMDPAENPTAQEEQKADPVIAYDPAGQMEQVEFEPSDAA